MGRTLQIMSLFFVRRARRNVGNNTVHDEGDATVIMPAEPMPETTRQQHQRQQSPLPSGRRIRQLSMVVVLAISAATAAAMAMVVLQNTGFSFSGDHDEETNPLVLSQPQLRRNLGTTSKGDDQLDVDRVIEILDRIGIESLCDTKYGSSSLLECDTSAMHRSKLRRLEECEEQIPFGLSATTWTTINIIGSIFCVFAVALMSSMFLGFMTLDPLDLRIKIRASMDSEERENAARLLPLVEDHHRLLVTLLLTDAVFYETMPIFLDNLFPSWLAILLSVTVLLVVGEIIPSAIFTGPEQLKFAAQLTPLMAFFLKSLYPVAYPLIWLLNYMVPPEDPEEEVYNRGELSALVRIQYEEREEARRTVNFTGLVPSTGKAPSMKSHPKRASTVGPVKGPGNVLTVTDKSRGWRNLKREIMEAVEQRHTDHQNNQLSTTSSTSSPIHPGFGFEGRGHRRAASIGSDHDSISTGPAYEQIDPPLHQAEVKMVEGALTMKTKCAWDVYTPLRKIFAVPYDMLLDRDTIADIYGEGYSRVPVFERMPPPNENRQYAMRGVLMTRQLIMIDWLDERPVSSLPLYYPPCISPRMNLVEVLQLLQKGGSHIAFVCAGPDLANKALEEDRAIPIEAGFMGLVTLEDVLEAILQDRIYDEEDVSDRDLASALLTQWAAKSLQRFYRNRVLAKQKQQKLTATASHESDDTPEIDDKADGDLASSAAATRRSQPRDPAAAVAIATSTALASLPPRRPVMNPWPMNPSIPEEIDLEIAQPSNPNASEKTPLLGRTSTGSTLSGSQRKK